jgi:hypothetical protein
MNTHYVVCKDCGADIAEWHGGANQQKQDEWVCQGKVEINCAKDNVFYNPKTGERSHIVIMDGGAGTQVKTPDGYIRLEKDNRSCAGVNNTTYCAACAKRHRYKCPICGSRIKKERSR